MPSACLVLLNGPVGIGKSTLARLLIRKRPLSLCVDIDDLRRSLGRWMDRPQESGVLACELALALVDKHVRAGHPIVVPQFLGDLVFVEMREQSAAALGVPFVHVVLMDEREAAVARFQRRAHAPDVTAAAGGCRDGQWRG